MRSTRDTFLHFISDNISSYYTASAVPVHGIWRSSDDAGSQFLKNNAINISFLGSNYDPHVGTQVCVIDIIHSDELTAIDWTDALWALLSEAFYTPQLDYSGDPAVPVATGSNIMWATTDVKFKPIRDEHYFRFSCRLSIMTTS